METYILRRTDGRAVFELAPGLNRVGRNPTNDVRIGEATVSSFHCEILVAEGGVTVRDVQSTNGTAIDGEPIKEGVIRVGQVLRLGEIDFRMELGESVAIAIPELAKPEVLPVQTHLLDGSLACLNHPGVRAASQCKHCGGAYCLDCARPVGLKGGASRVFCPGCKAECTVLPTEPAGRKKKETFLDRLTKTIRIAFRK
jgi:hypothetical protein